jgi:hypothetical protein
MNELITALIAAEEEFEPIIKDCRNKAQNFSYASMEAINQAIKPALRKHGLNVMFINSQEADDENPTLTLVLTHKSGEKLESSMRLTPSIMKNKDGREIQTYAQALAAANTSAKRLLLTSMLNLSLEEDEDSVFNPAEMQAHRVPHRALPQQQQKTFEKISSEQLLTLNKLLYKKGMVNDKFQADDAQRAAASSVIKEVCGGIFARADIPQKHFQALLTKLDAIPDALESSEEKNTEDISKWI